MPIPFAPGRPLLPPRFLSLHLFFLFFLLRRVDTRYDPKARAFPVISAFRLSCVSLTLFIEPFYVYIQRS